MTAVLPISAIKRMTAIVRKLVKWFYMLFAIAAISLAIIVQAGRSFSHLVADYPPEIARYFSEKLNAKVTIGALKAEWDGLKPLLEVQNLTIVSHSEQPIFALQKAQMRIDLLGSLLHGRLVWSVLSLNQVAMDFVQTADGFWHVSGVPRLEEKPNEPSVKLDPLIDMLLLSRRIEFDHTQFRFHFTNGEITPLSSPLLRMENAGDFHRLTLEVDVNNHPKTLTLVVEGIGDPRRSDRFTSKGFLKVNQFPTNEPIAAVTAFLLHGIDAEVHSEGALDAKLWFSSQPEHRGFDVVGNLSIQRLSLPLLGHKLTLDSFSSNILGNWSYTGKWQLAAQQIGANIDQNRIEKINFAVSAESFDSPILLHMQQLDLQKLNRTLDGAGVLGDGHLRDVLRQLNPEGELKNIQIALPIHAITEWELQANAEQIGVQAWQGVPVLRKVDGFIHASQKGGFVDIDSRNGFSMHYSPTYNLPMEYEQVSGQVAWTLKPDDNQIYVNSGPITFVNGSERAKGYLWLSLPWRRNTGDIDLYLQVGAQNLPASLYKKYVPAVIPNSLTDWLANSIGSKNPGHVSQVNFIYRGTLNNHNHASRTHQLFTNIENATLNYHPEWPALDHLNGRLLVSDDEIFADVDSARLYQSNVNPTAIDIHPNPDGHGSLLFVKGSVNGSAEDGLRILRESMLRRYLGAALDSWKLTGDLQTQVNIAVPLDKNGTGAAQQIDIDLNASSFEMKNLKLSLQNVGGKLSFNDYAGLQSSGLQATLFDEQVTALINTKKQNGFNQTLISVEGEVTPSRLAAWSLRPEVFFLQGKIPYSAQVELNHKTESGREDIAALPFAAIHVNSNLKGVALDLPAPYGKTKETERPFAFTLSLADQNSRIGINYADNLQALFDLDSRNDNKLLNANIALGQPAQLATASQFLLSGSIPSIDIGAWKKVLQQYTNYTNQIELIRGKPIVFTELENTALVAGLPFHANVWLGQYPVGPLILKDINLQADRLDDAWKIQFKNPVTEGNIVLPKSQEIPMQINLSTLHLDSKELGLDPVSDSALPVVKKDESENHSIAVDPRTLPLADVSVKELFMDKVNFGNWSLQIRPNSEGAVFDNINGTVKGVTVGGGVEHKAGARLEWNATETNSTTHFKGQLTATDLSKVLQQWQKPETLESTSAKFEVDINWEGDPQDFSLKKISGDVNVFVEKGRFKNNPSPGSDGFLRLMAVLNFDSLARRLRLDFSDLYKSGLAYDQINGKVNFAKGTMTFAEPLEVKTPSSRLQMAGKLDLEKEKINVRLVATLPVVGSYTFFTALVTGLPAAAGIYLVSKLFKKQVDQATSISYRIRGSWSEPKMSFDRLFESEESLIDNAKKADEIEIPDSKKPVKKTRKKQ